VILQAEPQAPGSEIRRDPPPGPVGSELPGVGLVAEGVIEQVHQPAPAVGVLDGHDRLDPAIQIALHEVG
jgi:hypothetical protein